MRDLKNLIILHSNDLHGDFIPSVKDGITTGGISLLSGYIQNVRNTEKNVLYTISGDMFRGSLIDSEYKGISTIEIMNLLTPDVATIGNHEVDYGIAHLLFLERCTKFPIINANVYIKMNRARLFNSHRIIEIDGMKILFIGLITEEVLAQTKQEAYIGSFVNVEEASNEVGKICNTYQTEDIDFTVLLTHIGIEADKQLASLLDPRWGVDLIIGGHSHTLMDKPVVINGIPIVQAGSGTSQIGRFDIVVDKDNNCIDSFTWKTVSINENTCAYDTDLDRLLTKYVDATNEKYGRVITRLKRQYTHPRRDRETELGKLFADILADSLGLDLMLVGSGSLRNQKLGPIVTVGDLTEMYPYSGEIMRIVVTGKQLKHMIRYLFREEVLGTHVHTEYYQFSHGIKIVTSIPEKAVLDIQYHNEPISDDALFRVGIPIWHYNNMDDFFDISYDEVKLNAMPKVITTDDRSVLDEYMSNREMIEIDESDHRWITIES